jgi:hypothetical protein
VNITAVKKPNTTRENRFFCKIFGSSAEIKPTNPIAAI